VKKYFLVIKADIGILPSQNPVRAHEEVADGSRNSTDLNSEKSRKNGLFHTKKINTINRYKIIIQPKRSTGKRFIDLSNFTRNKYVRVLIYNLLINNAYT